MRKENLMQLPIGYGDFDEIVRSKFDFVDKSLFIKEILDNAVTQVILITRPRRFGKTLNLSMLHCFLAAEVNRQSTQNLFNGLKIAEQGEQYWQHQGKYPVIFISFKDIIY
jgi:predicted AAA-ATPase